MRAQEREQYSIFAALCLALENSLPHFKQKAVKNCALFLIFALLAHDLEQLWLPDRIWALGLVNAFPQIVHSSIVLPRPLINRLLIPILSTLAWWRHKCHFK